jgi:hypothetical protein
MAQIIEHDNRPDSDDSSVGDASAMAKNFQLVP